MKEIALKAFAKINLSLDILGKRKDGYHEIVTIMHQIDLYDTVRVSLYENDASGHIFLECDDPFLPKNEENLACRAALLMLSQCGKRNENIKIQLTKRIPAGAGLGGGSADGAAVIHALSHLLGLNLSLKDLINIGTRLGADVPFCLMGQAAYHKELGFLKKEASSCALACGIGERLTPLPAVSAFVVLSKPPFNVSAAEIYKALCLNEIVKRPDTGLVLQGLEQGDFDKIVANMGNVLESVCEMRYPSIVYTKSIMESEEGKFRSMMSGSGPAVFSLIKDEALAGKLYQKIKEVNPETFLTKTVR